MPARNPWLAAEWMDTSMAGWNGSPRAEGSGPAKHRPVDPDHFAPGLPELRKVTSHDGEPANYWTAL